MLSMNAKQLLKKLEGKDLSRFGVRAESTLNHFIEDPKLINKTDLEFIEEVIENHY